MILTIWYVCNQRIIEYVWQDVSEALDSAGYEIDHGNPM